MQNHLLQVMALFAMEEPVSLDAEDIRNEKARWRGRWTGEGYFCAPQPGGGGDRSLARGSRWPPLGSGSAFAPPTRPGPAGAGEAPQVDPPAVD